LAKNSETEMSRCLTVPGDPPGENIVAHLRELFTHRQLIKLKIRTEDRTACDALGATLTARVPCELVKRIGHTLILYRQAPARPADDVPTRPAPDAP
jgi:RNA-binding protein YhbY